jgi:hypothetical protein
MNRRREIADRVIARWKASGFALDANARRLVELWIDGVIDAAEMRRQYLITVREEERARASRNTRTVREPQQLPGGAPAANPLKLDETPDLVHGPALPQSSIE